MLSWTTQHVTKKNKTCTDHEDMFHFVFIEEEIDAGCSEESSGENETLCQLLQASKWIEVMRNAESSFREGFVASVMEEIFVEGIEESRRSHGIRLL